METIPSIILQRKAELIFNESGKIFLMQHILMEEIKDAIFSVHDNKSWSGWYEFQIYEIALKNMKGDLLHAITENFNTTKLPLDVNHTFLSLIPKMTGQMV